MSNTLEIKLTFKWSEMDLKRSIEEQAIEKFQARFPGVPLDGGRVTHPTGVRGGFTVVFSLPEVPPNSSDA